jgi:hypothetical protein
MKLGPLAPVICLVLAMPALAQPAPAGWRDYDYPDAGFLIQFPAQPTTSYGTYPAPGGRSVPARIYLARDPAASFSVTVADFSEVPDEGPAITAAAIRKAGEDGEVKLDLEDHVDLQFGRELSIVGKDGARSAVVIFLIDRRLYVVTGKALPPDAEAHSDRIVRFVETLSFPNRPEEPILD